MDNARSDEAAYDGGSRRRHGRQRWLTGLRPWAGYGLANSARFAPTGSHRDGDSFLLTLKRRCMAWRAGGGDFLRKNSTDGMGLLRWLFGLTKTMGSFPSMSTSISRQRIGSGGGRFLHMRTPRVFWTSLSFGRSLR
jgi:hypothetical protein